VKNVIERKIMDEDKKRKKDRKWTLIVKLGNREGEGGGGQSPILQNESA
jgi:hypothetical protein